MGDRSGKARDNGSVGRGRQVCDCFVVRMKNYYIHVSHSGLGAATYVRDLFNGTSKKEKTYKRTPPTKPIASVTVPTVVIPPAFLQSLSIVAWAVVPSLLQNVRDVEQRIKAGNVGCGAIGRHVQLCTKHDAL